MKIIAHRGASGLALENTLESIKIALELDVDAIEFDIRKTKDNKLVLLHDDNTGRVADEVLYVHSATLHQLQEIRLHNGEKIPTLEEVLKLIDSKKPVVIDIKAKDIYKELVRLLKKYPQDTVSLTGLEHQEMQKVSKLLPTIPFYVQEHFSPFEIIQTAQRLRAKGISLNKWLVNPLTYYLAKHHNLAVRLYTVNHPFMVRFLKTIYPNIEIFTNYPHKYVQKRRVIKKRKVQQ